MLRIFFHFLHSEKILCTCWPTAQNLSWRRKDCILHIHSRFREYTSWCLTSMPSNKGKKAFKRVTVLYQGVSSVPQIKITENNKTYFEFPVNILLNVTLRRNFCQDFSLSFFFLSSSHKLGNELKKPWKS